MKVLASYRSSHGDRERGSQESVWKTGKNEENRNAPWRTEFWTSQKIPRYMNRYSSSNVRRILSSNCMDLPEHLWKLSRYFDHVLKRSRPGGGLCSWQLCAMNVSAAKQNHTNRKSCKRRNPIHFSAVKNKPNAPKIIRKTQSDICQCRKKQVKRTENHQKKTHSDTCQSC